MRALWRITRNTFFPWQCYQCGEKGEWAETKYEVKKKTNTEAEKPISICVHCFKKKEWLL